MTKRIAFPVHFDVAARTLVEALPHREQVVEMMTQLLLTSPGDRVNRPTFGCEARRLLFMPVNDAVMALVKASVYQAVETWMSEFVTCRTVTVTTVNSQVVIGVEYTLRATGTREFLNVEVGRNGSF